MATSFSGRENIERFHHNLLIIIFVDIQPFLSSLLSGHLFHKSTECICVLIKPNHHLHGSLNITKTNKAALILE